MIDFMIDDIVPCLREVATGELYDTEVVRIRRKSVLRKYNARTGWHVDWSKFPVGTEVYALVLQGTNDIQGMVAVLDDPGNNASHLLWASTAPQNNIWKYKKQRFSGVGGHLLAIASDLSVQHGHDGFIYAEAIDREIYDYYIEQFGAQPLPALQNPYRFMISGKATAHLREVYSYVWTDDVI